MKRFNFRIEDLELRSCGKHLLVTNVDHDTAEIVKWEKSELNYCYTLAYWIKTSEGYDLKFVGERPFNADKDIFWQLAKQGQDLLESLTT